MAVDRLDLPDTEMCRPIDYKLDIRAARGGEEGRGRKTRSLSSSMPPPRALCSNSRPLLLFTPRTQGLRPHAWLLLA